MSVHSSVGCVPILRFGTGAAAALFAETGLRRMDRRLCPDGTAGGVEYLEPEDPGAARGRSLNHRRCQAVITSGKNAHVTIVIAVTDPGAAKNGIRAFIVPTTRQAKRSEKLGLNASDTPQIASNGMKIPAENRLGEEGGGYRIPLSNLEVGHIGIAAQSVGMAQAAFEAARDYAGERKAFGKPFAEHQAVAFRVADMPTKIEAARQLVWHAASLREVGIPCISVA